MKKSTRNLLIGAGVTTLGIGIVSATSYFVSKMLFNVALQRETPEFIAKNMTKLSGTVFFGEFADTIKDAAEKLLNSETEEVIIESSDGIKLVGHWQAAKNPKRIIIAMHGWRSNWANDFGLASDFWKENDCSVLYAEQRGQGNSEGDYMGFGLLERYDCLDWINWVNNKTGGTLPIYLSGVSMGATTVLMAAGLDLPENVKGISADCGFTSPHSIWKHVSQKNLHIPYSSVHEAIINDMCKKHINMNADEYTTLDAMKRCKTPILFIHGTDDKFVPISMTYENYKACAAPKTLLVVPGAEHGMSFLVDNELYRQTAKQFWKEND